VGLNADVDPSPPMATTGTAAAAAAGTGDAILSVVAAVFFCVAHSSTDRTMTTDADVDPSRVFKNDGIVTLPLRFAAGGDDAVAVVVSFIGGAMTTMGGGGGTDDDSSPPPESASTTIAIWPSVTVASSSSARFPFVARRSKGGRRHTMPDDVG
jgi:hypothetical protein